VKQWKRYKSYILPYKSAFILGPLMMVTEVLGEILLPKFMSMIINHGVAQKDGGYILKMGLVMAITSFLMAAGGILGAYFAAKASISFTSDLRRDLFARVQQFSFKNIDTFSTGSLVTRLTNDIQQVQNLIMMGLRMMLRAPGMFLGACDGILDECGTGSCHPGGDSASDGGDRLDPTDCLPAVYSHAESAGYAQ